MARRCQCRGRPSHQRAAARQLLDGEIFYSPHEAEIVNESWRRHYNTVRPHASIGYGAPAREVFVPLAAWPAAQSRPAPPAMLKLAPRPPLNRHSNLTTKRGPINGPAWTSRTGNAESLVRFTLHARLAPGLAAVMSVYECIIVLIPAEFVAQRRAINIPGLVGKEPEGGHYSGSEIVQRLPAAI
jgi:hypothetical protein